MAQARRDLSEARSATADPVSCGSRKGFAAASLSRLKRRANILQRSAEAQTNEGRQSLEAAH